MKRVYAGALGALLAGSACSSATPPDPITSTDQVITVPIGSGGIEGLAVSPFELTPAFSPSITDYYIRCANTDNLVDLTVTQGDGDHDSSYVLAADQALAIGDDWIRCLPDSFPTIVRTTHPDVGSATPGYYLVDSGHFVMALDTHAVPVWYEAAASGGLVDSPAPDVLAYMRNAEYPYGQDMIPSFEIRDLTSGDLSTLTSPDAPTDEHELQRLPDGDYLMFADPIMAHVDLRGVPTDAAAPLGSDERIANCELEELTPDGTVVWSWLGTDHIDAQRESVLATHQTIHGVLILDPIHCNSVEVGSDGDLLISTRQTNALYDIDRATGTVRWKLGGTAYNKDGAKHIAVVGDELGGFAFQHDARFAPNGDITLYDDHGTADGVHKGDPSVARGIELAYDVAAGTASIVFEADGPEQSQFMGSFRRYADGHSVIGWGYLTGTHDVLSEVDGDGNSVLDIGFEVPAGASFFQALSYRAIKVPLAQLDHDLLRRRAAQ